MTDRVDCQICGAEVAKVTLVGGARVCMQCKKALAKRPVLRLPPQQPATVLSVDGYFALVQDLPLPSAQQRRNFVDYVVRAHSWDKHLPGFLPGVPFYFFLDRAAGCDWLTLREGTRAIAERNQQGFHYSDIPTPEYRSRFGFLSYSCQAGTTVFLLAQPLALPRDKVVVIPGENAQPCCLPQPILKAGRAELTAVIHPRFAASPFWAQTHLEAEDMVPVARRRLLWPHSEAQRPIYWPTESGGQGTVRRIFERCEEMRTPKSIREKSARVARHLKRQEVRLAAGEAIEESDDPFCDPVLQELIGPERQRQKTEMLKAIDRLCGLVQAAGREPIA
jgi:hypothetical protein